MPGPPPISRGRPSAISPNRNERAQWAVLSVIADACHQFAEARAVARARARLHRCAPAARGSYRAHRGTTSAPASSARSRGLSSTDSPRLPPDTTTASWSRQDSSMKVLCRVVCPRGLIPPTT